VLWLFWDEYIAFCLFVVLETAVNVFPNSNTQE
jgi:hypothetical protein